jgi:hypothetical protein
MIEVVFMATMAVTDPVLILTDRPDGPESVVTAVWTETMVE